MTGYEKSPDYGSPFNWRDVVAIAVIACAVILVIVNWSWADGSEKWYQNRLCDGMQTNRYIQSSRLYVDCVSDTHAIEVDFADRWANAIGQVLAYASEMKLRPGIILICGVEDAEENCSRHGYILEQTIAAWNISLTLWRCGHEAEKLADCRPIEIGPSSPDS